MNYFDYEKLFKNNEFRKIDTLPSFKKFYLLRSISKKNSFNKFCKAMDIKASLNDVFLNDAIHDRDISDFIKNNFQKVSQTQIKQIEQELNKMQNFDWGGSDNNNLEKNIVKNYVNKILNYETIVNTIGGDILKSVYGWTLNSWYNYWSSVLIENIIKTHCRVLPTIELIEKIDFFIDDIPFDLKVTNFPNELIESSIKLKLKNKYNSVNELICSINIAKQLGISIPTNLSDKSLKICLYNLLKESDFKIAKEYIDDLNKFKKDTIDYYKKNTNELIIWLYENQGEMRFDAANRYYIILIDSNNIYESWKLKRNVNLIKKNIDSKLNAFDITKLLPIEFYWKKDGKKYKCISDLVFISK